METQKHKITVLEDSEFFNRLMVFRLVTYGKRFAEDRFEEIEMSGYTHPGDFLRNLQSDTAVAFIDYYLGGSMPAEEVIRQVRKTAPACAIFVVSRASSEAVVQRIFSAGANGFIPKTPQVFDKICLAMEAAIRHKGM